MLLPPRQVPLLLVAGKDQNPMGLAEDLAGRGRQEVALIQVGRDDLAFLPQKYLASGPGKDHLWQPPPWLFNQQNLLPPPAMGPVLDLGCGSGRAAVWLAAKGYQVTGIDWQPEALKMGQELAASQGVSCRFLQGDLRQVENIPPGPWAVILNFRFLQREIVDRMAGLLSRHGVCFLNTFRDAPGYVGHPQLRHRLATGELLRMFPRGSFQVLAHEEGFDPDGRPSAGIVARRA